MRVLITGGSGLLALNWACAIRDRYEVVLATHRRRVELVGTRSQPVALDDADRLTAQLDRLAPALIVHAAGLTSVDECEREPDAAHEANAVLAQKVATAAARLGMGLIHVSTDHLFAGTRAHYTEEDAPEPLNVYAQTKLLAEQWVQKAHPGALIVRTNFFGWGHRYRQSFSDWILDGLRRGTALTLFDDVFFTPILADRLATAAHELHARSASGIFNIVGDERLSKHSFAVRLARAFGLPEALVQHGKIAHSRLPAKRPLDMSLDNLKARRLLGAPLGDTAAFFRDLRQQETDGRRDELLAAVAE